MVWLKISGPRGESLITLYPENLSCIRAHALRKTLTMQPQEMHKLQVAENLKIIDSMSYVMYYEVRTAIKHRILTSEVFVS